MSEENLPIIKIISQEDEMFTKLGLEMDDDTMAMLIRWGKKDASDEDYVNIAIREGLINNLKERESKENENND